jgi:hypothetical protein
MFATRLADSLFIISLFFSLVKCFFQISLIFSLGFLFSKRKDNIHFFNAPNSTSSSKASRAAPTVLPFRFVLSRPTALLLYHLFSPLSTQS